MDAATPPGVVLMSNLFLSSAPITPSASSRVTALSAGSFSFASYIRNDTCYVKIDQDHINRIVVHKINVNFVKNIITKFSLFSCIESTLYKNKTLFISFVTLLHSSPTLYKNKTLFISFIKNKSYR